jgi:hypothetical protein
MNRSFATHLFITDMKKLLVITMLLGGLFTACTNQAKEENSHQHEDGSTHADHDAAQTPTNQEEFSVDTLRTDTTTKDSSHSHEGGKEHKH